MTHIASVPDELLVNILLNLDPLHLAAALPTSRRFARILSDRAFLHFHIARFNNLRSLAKPIPPSLYQLIPLSTADRKGQTPVHILCQSGHLHTLSSLLAHHSSLSSSSSPLPIASVIDQSDNYGFTPLAYAVINHHLSTVQFLLSSYRVNIHAQNFRGESPLIHAVKSGSLDILKLLLFYHSRSLPSSSSSLSESLPISTLIHAAADNGHANILSHLLSLNPEFLQSINQRDSFGHTALHKVSINRDLPCLKVLLAKGAQPNVPDFEGKLPMYYALSHPGGFDEGVRMLLDNNRTDEMSALKHRRNTWLAKRKEALLRQNKTGITIRAAC
ncbi:ankyrin repeat-containing domain protein [Paraphysoderma sedebokerense]|nr:ankyrin repeat-containing domain protein [Paraphysoderma sedebokerense]